MEKGEKRIIFVLIILGIVLTAGFIIHKLTIENHRLREALPYFLMGERIEYFDVLNKYGERTDASKLNGGRLTLIFIFSRPCTACNKNLVFWKKMGELMKDEADIYGVVLDDAEHAFQFEEKANPGFGIYIPYHRETFIKRMRIKLNLSQTIIYKNGVKKIHLGDMKSEGAIKIIKLLKTLTETKQKSGEK